MKIVNKTKKLDNDIVKLCEHFADKCVVTNISEYEFRNQSNPDKIKKDITLGKIGEFGVYFILNEAGVVGVSPPDLNIYDKKDKTFDSDLKCKNNFYQIKTQSLKSSLKYGTSWMFQKKDPLVNDPKDNEYFVGSQIDENTYEVKVLLCKQAKKLVFSDPVLKHLSSKTCVYLKDNQ